jgi:hypothetical protein
MRARLCLALLLRSRPGTHGSVSGHLHAANVRYWVVLSHCSRTVQSLGFVGSRTIRGRGRACWALGVHVLVHPLDQHPAM